MRPWQSEAIILRRTNYGEADRILTLLTSGHGKVSAIAKGVRKPKSKLAGELELLAVCQVGAVEGRGEMSVVTSARLKKFFGNILQDYDRMQFAYEAIAQINKATNTVVDEEFYMLLKEILTTLNDLNYDWRLTELGFRLRLASLLGSGLNLITDNTGLKLQQNESYLYSFEEGAFCSTDKGSFKSDHIKLLRLALLKPASLKHIVGLEQVLGDCLWLARRISI